MARATVLGAAVAASLSSACLLSACGSDSSSDVDAGWPDARPPCVMEDEVAKIVATDSVDCGVVDLTAGDYVAAHDCVATTFGDGASFHVLWQSPGIDSTIRGGYVGNASGGAVAVRRLWYDSDPSGGSNAGAVLSAAMCQEFSAGDGCAVAGDYYSDLCFTCTPVGTGEWLCRP